MPDKGTTHLQMVKYAEDMALLYQQLKAENEALKKAKDELEGSYFASILTAFDLMNIHNEFLAGHCKRVAYYAAELGKSMNLSEADLLDLKMAALLHDIELMGLKKEELVRFFTRAPKHLPELYRKHPEVNLTPILSLARFKTVGVIIRHHHERIDGTGFPDGIKGVDIPLESKILAVCDGYDILKLQMKEKAGVEIILSKMEDDVGLAYDPEIYEQFSSFISDNDVFSKTRKISFGQLRPGMILAEAIFTTGGMKLLGAESTITQSYIELLKRYALSGLLRHPITIYRQQG